MQKHQTITETEFYEMLLVILTDELVANCSKEENGIKVDFLNGQNFLLSIQ